MDCVKKFKEDIFLQWVLRDICDRRGKKSALIVWSVTT